MTLALAEGVAGIVFGLAGSHAIARVAQWSVLVTPASAALAFGFAAAIGIFFGLYPARRSAALDPIAALRFE